MTISLDILPTSINDLKDNYFDGIPLSKEEELALENFDQYRISKLNSIKSDAEFKLVYIKIQAMANLSPYFDFLDLETLSLVD